MWLGNRNHVCITTLRNVARPSVFLSFIGAPSPCAAGNVKVLEKVKALAFSGPGVKTEEPGRWSRSFKSLFRVLASTTLYP